MIVRWTDDGWFEEDGLLTALNMSGDVYIPRVVSVVGAGGKTTVIRRLQGECLQEKIGHVVTTTTHMQYEKAESFLSEGSLERVMELAGRLGTVWLGEPVSEEKMKGPSVELLCELYESGLWLLVEADGARRLPVKAPEEHEPVIVPFSTDVICVYGMDAVGCPIGEVCCRVNRVTELLGKTPQDLLEAVDIVRLAVSADGGRKAVTEDMRYAVLLNKVDTTERLKEAAKIAGMLRKKGVDTVLATSLLLSQEKDIR